MSENKELDDLLQVAKYHVITEEERQAQRQSWVRGEMELAKDERETTTRLQPPPRPEQEARTIDRLIAQVKVTLAGVTYEQAGVLRKLFEHELSNLMGKR